MTDYLTVKQAAKRLGVDVSRVKALLHSNPTKRSDALPPLTGKKFGWAWMVDLESVERRRLAKNTGSGRP